jgi:hypothetical protein
MDIKQFLGEVSKKEIISKGDYLYIEHLERGTLKIDKGILVEATPQRIKINGTTPLKEIDANNIIKITKLPCS